MAKNSKKVGSKNHPIWVDVAEVVDCSLPALGQHIKWVSDSRNSGYGYIDLSRWDLAPAEIRKELTGIWVEAPKGTGLFILSSGRWQPVKASKDGMYCPKAFNEAKAQFIMQESPWQKFLPALEKMINVLPPGFSKTVGAKKRIAGDDKDIELVHKTELGAETILGVEVNEGSSIFDLDAAMVALQNHGLAEIEARILLESLRKENSEDRLVKVFAKLPIQTPENWWEFLKGRLKMAEEEDKKAREARKRRSSLVL